MSGYRDWQHPPGAAPEAAPERLIDIYTVPGLIEPGSAPVVAAGPEAGLSLIGWLLPLAVLLVLAGGWAWRRRRDLRLAWALRRLERRCRARADTARACADALVTVIGCWQHGRLAPRRDKLAAPWSDWVREIDHARFGATLDADWLAGRLRRMRRRALTHRGTA